MDIMEEIQKLKKENDFLKEKLAEFGYFCESDQILNKADKIAIFRDYFKGRDDVYAKSYYDKRKGKIAYTVACQNEGNQDCWNRKHICKECPFKKKQALTDFVLELHFKESNKAIGLYPLMDNNTCYLLAMDFDGNNWFEDMKYVYRIAKSFHIVPLMEKSRSGDGGHLWFFFENPIKAVQARNFGNCLLGEAMRISRSLKFAAFDRMFPSQDYINESGIGNCIALPLSKDAFSRKNSVFINENGEYIPNQIQYLRNIRKITDNEIQSVLSSLTKINEYFTENIQLSLFNEEYPKYSEKIQIVIDSMLHFRKSELNALTANMIKRIASMHNPKYYEMQRLHKSIYNIPRVLSEYEENDVEIIIPKGLLDTVKEVFRFSKLEIVDNQSYGNEIPVSFKGELRREQDEAVSSLLKHNNAILYAATGFGKTVIAIYIIAKLKVNTLIIVPTEELLNQWKQRLEKYLEYPISVRKRDLYIGELSGKKKKIKGNIDIAIINSLATSDEQINTYGLVIVDECHHASSDTFRKVLRRINSARIYSFTATPKRGDGLEKILHMYLGKIQYETDIHAIIQSHHFSQILIPRFTTFYSTCPRYMDIMEELICDESRNMLIVKDIYREYCNKRHIVVLSDRVKHLEILFDKLQYMCPNTFLVHGNLKNKERKVNLEEVLKSSSEFVLLATSKLLGEGFDLPILDTLFMVFPVSLDNRVNQYTGRIHRNIEGKNEVLVYDYIDSYIHMLDSMFYNRLKEYKRLGYKIKEKDGYLDVQKIMYRDNSLEVCWKDIQHAQKQVVIFLIEVSLEFIKENYVLFQSLRENGIQLLLMIGKTVNEEMDKYLRRIGFVYSIQPVEKEYIIIDSNIVWMFENLISRNCMVNPALRLVNKDLAKEILLENSNQRISLFD